MKSALISSALFLTITASAFAEQKAVNYSTINSNNSNHNSYNSIATNSSIVANSTITINSVDLNTFAREIQRIQDLNTSIMLIMGHNADH